MKNNYYKLQETAAKDEKQQENYFTYADKQGKQDLEQVFCHPLFTPK